MKMRAREAVRLAAAAAAVLGAWRLLRWLGGAARHQEEPVHEPSLFWSLGQRRP
jgi:hypothetical protein